MKPIDSDTAEDARELFTQIQDAFSELNEIMRQSMERSEYERFRYLCLGHCEPALFHETQWATRYSSIIPLEKYVEELEDSVSLESEEDEEVE